MEIDKGFLLSLVRRKDELESAIEANHLILQSQNNVGMNESLVDHEGYPRNDIDVYKVRHARHTIICLQNDHKSLMKQIEEGLNLLHQQEKTKTGNISTNFQSQLINDTHLIEKCFAKIDLVSSGSPAEEAGLKVGDLISEFGSINKKNFANVQDIAVLVQHSVGHSVGLDVVRDKNMVHLSLIPKPWKEKGLLGCRIVPLH